VGVVLWELLKEIDMASTPMKKLKSDIDVKYLYDELFDINNKQKFAALRRSGGSGEGLVNGKTDIIIVSNSANDQRARETMGEEEPTIWEYDYPELYKFFKWFTAIYGGTVRKANYYNTPPGSGVKSHVDYHRYFRDKDRFHLVLSGQYKYTVHGETEIFSKGDLWWFNNKLEHKSYNHGDEDKINLVFDVAGLRT